MPYVQSVVSVKLTEEQKENIKKRIGQAMNEMPGKSEEWLFVGFQDDNTLYFRGNKLSKGAVIEVKLLGKQERQAKDDYTNKLCTIFSEEIGVPGENIYVIYTEYEDGSWGWNGNLF